MNFLYKLIRTVNLLIAILPGIALYRATVQPDYKWGLLTIQGTGKSSDYIWLLLFTILAWASFILERWYKRKWYYLLPLLLFSLSFGTAVYGLVSEASIQFKGDAWKISFDMGLLVTLITGVCVLATVIWTIRDNKSFLKLTWSPDRRLLTGLVMALLLGIIILFLFSLGKGGIHSNMDRLAVVFTVIQGLLLAYIVDSSSLIRSQ